MVIIGFLTLSTGALIAVQGYNTLSNVGIEALTGFLGAFLNVRFIAPATAGVALAATIGAGATAQIGAMRINEEIDALEVMGIRVITYLASTRIVAGVVAVIPIYTVAVLMSFLATRFGTDRLADHYEELAHHFVQGEAWEKAFDSLVLAGDKAKNAYATQTALDFYARALAWLRGRCRLCRRASRKSISGVPSVLLSRATGGDC